MAYFYLHQVLSSVPGVYQDLARDVFDCLQREGVINHGVLPLGMCEYTIFFQKFHMEWEEWMMMVDLYNLVLELRPIVILEKKVDVQSILSNVGWMAFWALPFIYLFGISAGSTAGTQGFDKLIGKLATVMVNVILQCC
jgi:hypothetical protein